MTVTAGPLERFEGFPEGGIPFLLELQAEQSREWFRAHQQEYQRLWRRPMELFMAELHERLRDVYPGVAETRPHLFRIQRDTRFSHDKAPYKTNVAADLGIRPAPDGEHGAPGIYVSFGLDGEVVGIGCWHLEGDHLRRYREALDHPVRGPEAQTIADHLLAEGFELASMQTLKRVPPPYPQDHPRADLLKRKGLAATAVPTGDLGGSRALLDWAEGRLRAAAPLVHWLEETVA